MLSDTKDIAVITAAVCTLMFAGTVVVNALRNKTEPSYFGDLFKIVFGYFLGAVGTDF